MKLGIKTFCNENFLKHFENSADFFEIQAIQKNNYDFLKKFSKPLVIHAEHYNWGINPADKNLYKKNKDSINFAMNLANKTNAKKVIVHPGNINNKNCSIEQAIDFIKSLNDKRIIIENLPGLNIRLCETPEETKEFLRLTKAEFCFDINHAIESAFLRKVDYMNFVKEFIKSNPKHYHLGGQKIINFIFIKKSITHLSFKQSNIPLKEILKLFPKDAEITLEVTTDIEKTKEDLKFIRNIIKEL